MARVGAAESRVGQERPTSDRKSPSGAVDLAWYEWGDRHEATKSVGPYGPTPRQAFAIAGRDGCSTIPRLLIETLASG